MSNFQGDEANGALPWQPHRHRTVFRAHPASSSSPFLAPINHVLRGRAILRSLLPRHRSGRGEASGSRSRNCTRSSTRSPRGPIARLAGPGSLVLGAQNASSPFSLARSGFTRFASRFLLKLLFPCVWSIPRTPIHVTVRAHCREIHVVFSGGPRLGYGIFIFF